MGKTTKALMDEIAGFWSQSTENSANFIRVFMKLPAPIY